MRANYDGKNTVSLVYICHDSIPSQLINIEFTTMESQTLQEKLHSADQSMCVALLFEYILAHGSEHYEEDVTQYQHATQSALLAQNAGAIPELITSALLHDIGHMLADDPLEANNPTIINDFHEELAANYLSPFFPDSVTEPIRLHVPAKRYICTVDPIYYDLLSVASQKSFHLQGGYMSEDEIKAFENNPYYKEAVMVRRWDDLAKDVTLPAIDINIFEQAVMSSVKG